MTGFRIAGGISGNPLEVNSDNEMKTALTRDNTKAGYVVMFTESDDGYVTGTPYNKSPETSKDYRLRVGMDTLVFSDTLNYAAQDTSKWVYRNSTTTVTWGSGYMSLNGGASTAAGSAVVGTYKNFTLFGTSPIYCETSAAFSAVPPVNFLVEFGLYQHNAGGAPYAALDGVFFRVSSAGVCGVISYAGSETPTEVFMSAPTIGINNNRKWVIVLDQRHVEYWIDDVLYAKQDTPSGNGQPVMAGSMPYSARIYQADVAGAVCQFKISNLTIEVADIQFSKDWQTQLGSMGFGGYQGAPGGTLGTTALYSNSLAAGAGATATNTTAALGSGLGGQFSLQPALTANTDGIISSYQNPAGSTTYSGRNLLIYGVKISGIVTTVLSNGPVYGFWSLAFGHNTVTLATAESATAKAPRRIPLGIQTWAVNAAVGTQADREIQVTFQVPIVVYPGEFVQTVFKNVGTVTASGVITFLITFDSLFE
jgi:hypothetical protein